MTWPIEHSGPTVYVFCPKAKPPKWLRDCVDSRVRIIGTDDPWMWQQTDLYVMRTQLNAQSEAAAAKVGTSPIVLPEMNDYLTGKIKALLLQGDLFIFVPATKGEQPPRRT